MSALGVQSAPALVERVSSVERAEGVGLSGANGFVAMTASELKASLASSRRRGVVLDIDETLSATNVAWFERLADIFGNPGGESVDVLIRRFQLAQHVPFWQNPEALEWMQRQRDDPKAQDDLPLIGGAVEGAHALMRHVPVVGSSVIASWKTLGPHSSCTRQHGHGTNASCTCQPSCFHVHSVTLVSKPCFVLVDLVYT